MIDQVTVLRKAEGTFPMLKNIKIGDPMYFEIGGDNLKHTYSRHFKQKSEWVCELEVLENLNIFQSNTTNNVLKYKDITVRVHLAYDKKMLSLLKECKVYTRQTEKLIKIEVDTASYIISINNKEELITTGGDGIIGFVFEYYTNRKLEAVALEFTMPNNSVHTFENVKESMKHLFNCSLTDVEV